MTQKEKEMNLLLNLKNNQGVGNRQNLGYYTTPWIISDFIVEFATHVKPKLMLNPVAGLGSLLRTISDSLENNISITAIEINPDTASTATQRSKEFPINYIKGDAIQVINNLVDSYDFIVGDLPWGMIGKMDNDLSISDVGINILLKSLEKLITGGYAIFTYSDAFFGRFFEKIQARLEKLGVELVGVVKISTGTYYPRTGVQSNILIFHKIGLSEKIFLGELLEKNYLKMVKNFFNKESSDDFNGRIIEKGSLTIYSLDYIKAQESIEKLIKQGKIVKISGCEVLSNVDLDLENSVYVTSFGFPKVKLFFTEEEIKKIKNKKARYFQIKLPNGFDTKVFALLYNGSFGRTSFGLVVNDLFQSISIKSLRNLSFYYPGPKYVNNIQVVYEKLQSLKNIVVEVEKTLQADIFAVGEVKKTVEKIDILSDVEYIIKDSPSVIAKVYKHYKTAVENEDYRLAFDTMDNLFTLTPILLSSIFLGGIQKNKTLTDIIISKEVREGMKDFKNLGYGNSSVLLTTLSKQIRDRLHSSIEGEKDMMVNLFGVDSYQLLEDLTKKDIAKYLLEFVPIRNDYIGHKGKAGDLTYKKLVIESKDLLNNFILSLSSLKYIKIFLATKENGRIAESEYECKVTIFNGYDSDVKKITLDDQPIIDTLYCLIGGSVSPIKLPDMIKYENSSNDLSKVPYFYSKFKDKDNVIEYVNYEEESARKMYSQNDIQNILFRSFLFDN